MLVIPRLLHTDHMRIRSEHDEDMEDLVRGADEVKVARAILFRDP